MFQLLLKGTILTNRIYSTSQSLLNHLNQQETMASYFYSQIMYFEESIYKNRSLIDALQQIQNISLLMDILDQFYIRFLIEANTIFKNQITLESQLQQLIQKCFRKLVKQYVKPGLYKQIKRLLQNSYKEKEKEIIELYQKFNISGNLKQVYETIQLHTKKIIKEFQTETKSISFVLTGKYQLKLLVLIQIQINPIIHQKLQNSPKIIGICMQQLKQYFLHQRLNWDYIQQPQYLIQHLFAIILSIEFRYEELQIVFEMIRSLGNQFLKDKEIKFITDQCHYLFDSINNEKNQQNESEVYKSQFQKEREQKYDFLQKIGQQYNSEQFWKTQISQEDNLKTIINLIIYLSGFKFIDNKFQIDRYKPECRSILIKISNKLQNKEYGYLNISIIQAMEAIFGQLQLDLLNQLNFFIGKTQGIQNAQFQFQCQLQDDIIPLNSSIQNFEMYSTQFQLISSLQHPFTMIDLQDIKRNCFPLIEHQIDEIYNIYLHRRIAKPIFLFFQQVSAVSQPSNVITICISGFTSETECKAKKWEQLARSTKSHVIGLNFQNCHILQIAIDVGLSLTGILLAPEALLVTLAGKYFSNNFTDAENEAERVGIYLGYLIGYSQIFGNSLINLVGFSLGTVVIQKCIETLDQIHLECGKRFLNDVLLMGGAADVEQLKNCNLESINGRLINVYSKDDQILKYIHQFFKRGHPCGIQKLSNISPKVQNYDMTHMIEGHNSYQKNYEELLKVVGFEQDFNV